MQMVFRRVPGGVAFCVKVVPGSTRNRVVGALGDSVKVTVSAAPEKDKANQALITLLAEALHTNRRAVTIVSGRTGPLKTVVVAGVTADACEASLLGRPGRET